MLGALWRRWRHNPEQIGDDLAWAYMADGVLHEQRLDPLWPGGRVRALTRAVLALRLDDRTDLCPPVVERLGRLDARAALPFAYELAAATPPWAGAAEVFRGVLDSNPRHVEARAALARLLADLGDIAAAREVLSHGNASDPALARAAAHLQLEDGDVEGATEALRQIANAALHDASTTNDPRSAQALYREGAAARRDHWHLTQGDAGPEGELLGHLVPSGALELHSGANHMLVARAAMTRSPRVCDATRLTDATVAHDAAVARLLVAPDDRVARVRLGESLLRRGRAARAVPVFRALLEEDRGYFPAHLGYGAALEAVGRRWLEHLRGAWRPALDPRWGDVLLDVPVLTDDERVAVAAQLQGLGGALAPLRAAGVRVQLLPIDVRPTDLSELAPLSGARVSGSHVDGLEGLATTGTDLADHAFATARVETLLDLTGGSGFTLGHEVAHLALWHLPPEVREEADEILAHAHKHLWAADPYALQNADELFATSYEQWLMARLAPQRVEKPDAVGVARACERMIEAVARLPIG